MYPRTHAQTSPDKPAVIMAERGASTTYAQLDQRSSSLAQYLYDQGLRRGDVLAIFLENHVRYFEAAWAAYRSGLYMVTISRYSTEDDLTYTLEDAGVSAVVSSDALAAVAVPAAARVPGCQVRLMVDGVQSGWTSFEDTVADYPRFPVTEESRGEHMPYSSGTTGRPKGIRREMAEGHPANGFESFLASRETYTLDERTIYLSPAPLYHAAPIQFCLRITAFGGTVVLMIRFDALGALESIERFAITHSQWVPTMFVRLLKLSDQDRFRWDLSSHRCAIHAAAPCPVEVKHQMIDWWGPIMEEYYAGSERNGSTRISSAEWLRKPGSVGQANSGILHICDEDGTELEAGDAGIIYFEQPETPFVYHNDPDKTRDSTHPQNPTWTTLGDIGYTDEDGYLYLTDRKSFMIISGGVNIYPRMIEDALVLHPEVTDVAVIGVPNEEFGEEVKAIVEPAKGVTPGPDLEARLIEFARDSLAPYLVPRSVDFLERMPRLPTGKLPKRVLREPYWQGTARSGRI